MCVCVFPSDSVTSNSAGKFHPSVSHLLESLFHFIESHIFFLVVFYFVESHVFFLLVVFYFVESSSEPSGAGGLCRGFRCSLSSDEVEERKSLCVSCQCDVKEARGSSSPQATPPGLLAARSFVCIQIKRMLV